MPKNKFPQELAIRGFKSTKDAEFYYLSSGTKISENKFLNLKLCPYMFENKHESPKTHRLWI